ncbi:MAG: hypothetical protein OEW26_08195 [Nitrospirota bacterium]|nr:hypothetical protein [Nitrospirota bacterium]
MVKLDLEDTGTQGWAVAEFPVLYTNRRYLKYSGYPVLLFEIATILGDFELGLPATTKPAPRTMAHHTSSKEKTVLWIIIPLAIGLTLLFVWRNHQISGTKTPAGSETTQVEVNNH